MVHLYGIARYEVIEINSHCVAIYKVDVYKLHSAIVVLPLYETVLL